MFIISECIKWSVRLTTMASIIKENMMNINKNRNNHHWREMRLKSIDSLNYCNELISKTFK